MVGLSFQHDKSLHITFNSNSYKFLPALTEPRRKNKDEAGSSMKYPEHEYSFEHMDKASQLYQIVMSESWQNKFKR